MIKPLSFDDSPDWKSRKGGVRNLATPEIGGVGQGGAYNNSTLGAMQQVVVIAAPLPPLTTKEMVNCIQNIKSGEPHTESTSSAKPHVQRSHSRGWATFAWVEGWPGMTGSPRASKLVRSGSRTLGEAAVPFGSLMNFISLPVDGFTSQGMG